MSIMATLAILAPVGCSIGDDEEPKPASGAPAEIAAAVERLERAIASRDFATVCNELFTTAARKRSGGDDCVTQLRSAAEGVRQPAIEVRGIQVNGERATVEVTTRAAGQARVRDELRMRRVDGRWRVEALS
jgi:Putative lumazine-binding